MESWRIGDPHQSGSIFPAADATLDHDADRLLKGIAWRHAIQNRPEARALMASPSSRSTTHHLALRPSNRWEKEAR
ncbi:hypothetical protein [Micromonospora endolithica]|uniref:hypothetical protein n=1 Tax=Micromonospora endolithica TaxID=230091 RepID=UPI0011BEB201|nr:hypothetical protein [Micromonospora endolithica]